MSQLPAVRYDAVSHLLGRVGLLAFAEGIDEAAEQIFAYLRRVLADPSALEVARSIVMLDMGRPLDAIRILRDEVLSVDMSHGAANLVCGMAIAMADLPDSRQYFETVLAASLDPTLRTLALAELTAA